MSSSIAQKIIEKAREVQTQANQEPRIDALASEAEGAKEIVNFGGFGARLNADALIESIQREFAEACKKIAPQGVKMSVADPKLMRASLEPTREILASAFIPLATMTFTDGSGALGMHFTDAGEALHAIRSIPGFVVEASVAQMDTDAGIDVLNDDISLEDLLEDDSALQSMSKKRDPRVLALYAKAGEMAVAETLGKALKAFSFEPNMSSFAISEYADAMGELFDTFVDAQGVSIDAATVSATAANAPMPPSEEAATADAQAPDANAAAPRAVPQKRYTAMGQMIKANDATALERVIKATKEEGLWGRDKVDQMNTMLFHAAAMGHVEVARVLLDPELGAAVMGKFRAGDTGMNDLMAAAVGNHTKMIELLADRGAKLNETNGAGQDALMLAAAAGSLEAVKTLAELNDEKLRALAKDLAQEEASQDEIVEQLNKRNILLTQDLNDRTALHMACQSHFEINDSGSKPEEIEEGLQKMQAVIEELLALNIDPTHETMAEQTLAAELLPPDADDLFNKLEDYREAFKPTDPLTYLGKADEPAKKAGWGSRMFGPR